MKIFLSIVAIHLVLNVFLGFTQPAFAYDSYQSFRARPISLNVNFEYFKTDANYHADGSKANLLPGQSFQNMSLSPSARWQFGSSFALLGGFNYGNTESVDSSFSRKSGLVNRVDFGAEYLFLSNVWIKLFSRVSYGYALEKIDYTGDTVLTSNGASEIRPEIILNLDFEDGLYTFLKGGFNIREEGLSTLGTYGAGAELRFSRVGIGASILGQLTVKEDENSQRASFRDNLNNRVNAGSKIYNAVNPNSHGLELNLNILFSRQSQIKIYSGSTLLGSNTAAGVYVGTNINWVFDFMPAISAPSKKAPARRESPELLFKEKTDDGVNQDYFKPVTPVAPEYIQQIEGSQKNLQQTTEPDPDEMIQTKKIPTKTKGYKIKLRKAKKKS